MLPLPQWSMDQETKCSRQLKFSLAGLPRNPNERGQWKSHIPTDLQATIPRTLKGKGGESKEVSKLFFTPRSKRQAPAATLGIVQQRTSTGQTVWWATVKVWLCTASQNGTQSEADFDKHPPPHYHHWTRFRDAWRGTFSHDPQATTGAGSMWQLLLSNQLWLWLLSSQVFVRITVPFNVLSVPRALRTPHPSAPASGSARQGCSPAPHSPAQPCPPMEAAKLGTPPILGSSYLQECACCQGLGLSPAVSLRSLVPRGIAPLSPSPQRAATPAVPWCVFP